jgi:hypothetical protein
MRNDKTNVNVKINEDVWNLFTYLRKKNKLTRDQALEMAVSVWNDEQKKEGKKK